ncbi:MAG: helix-turn-helix domain-containing protein [Clostridia bacterium]|nr:helix-turn-helix domain-containing protein [Clostridia bacterium]
MIPDIELMSVQRAERPAGCHVAEESHNWHEFVYYISCEGSLTLGGQRWEIRPGRFCTTRPGTLHSEQHTADGIVFFCIFQCDAPLADQVFDDDCEQTILHLCEAIITERRRPRPLGEDIQKLIFQELLLRVLRWESCRKNIRRDIAYAAECIESGFQQISLQSLAADIGYGYDYFQHRFKEVYGRSPKQYQMDCRIRHAKELLAAGRYNCTEIAYLCGFSDSAQFSAVFRRACGCSPTKWGSV